MAEARNNEGVCILNERMGGGYAQGRRSKKEAYKRLDEWEKDLGIFESSFRGRLSVLLFAPSLYKARCDVVVFANSLSKGLGIERM